VAKSLNQLGIVHRYLNEYVEARELYERALAIRERTLAPDDPEIAKNLLSLGILRQRMGDARGAIPLLRRALEIQENALGQEHPRLTRYLVPLSQAIGADGRTAEAIPLLERCMILQPGDPTVVYTLGLAYTETGHALKGRPLLERALQMFEEQSSADHHFCATTLLGLADTYVATGELETARELLERAHAIQERGLGPEHLGTVESLSLRAELHYLMGDETRALELILQAERFWQQHLRLTNRVLSEVEALQYATQRTSNPDVLFSLASSLDDPAAVGALWDALIQARAPVLDELAERRRSLHDTADSTGIALRAELATAGRDYAQLLHQGAGAAPPEEYLAQLNEARECMGEAERRLGAWSASYRRLLDREAVDLASVAGTLPAGSALVSFVRFNRIDRGQTKSLVFAAPATPSYLAFVLPPGAAEPAVVPIGAAADVDLLVARWRDEAVAGAGIPGRTPVEAERFCREAGLALRHEIWDPLQPHLAAARQVFVVPASSLHLINLAALPAEGGRYLADEEPLLHTVTCERDLVGGDPAPAAGGLLAMGGALYDLPGRLPEETAPLLAAAAPSAVPPTGAAARAAGDCRAFDEIRFEHLRASEGEVETIAAIWRAQGGEALILRGAEASEHAFKRYAPGRAILHVATHGFFLDELCRGGLEGSRGVSGMRPADADPPAGTMESEPPLLSGLALAGANLRDGAALEDGILMAEEIAALDLQGVAWAVLSACDTGIGPIGTGEGVFGLRRSLQVAGVGTVILSLWSVRDADARPWMESLYHHRFNEGAETARAVQAAYRDILRTRRAAGESTHPYYWAGFVAAGDWR
jgi:CHAT domain-containing protein/tetratricopeptide (TPR) repeat protein